jgi:hypothetical protein
VEREGTMQILIVMKLGNWWFWIILNALLTFDMCWTYQKYSQKLRLFVGYEEFKWWKNGVGDCNEMSSFARRALLSLSPLKFNLPFFFFSCSKIIHFYFLFFFILADPITIRNWNPKHQKIIRQNIVCEKMD